MKQINYFFKQIVIIGVVSFLFFFLFFFDVHADTAGGFGYPAPTQGGGTGNCMSQWGGCWLGPSYKAFRLTLVDFNGKKIEGTKSVDFSSNNFYNCPNGKNCGFSAYSLINGYYDKTGKYIARYDYKYSDKFNDYSVASNIDEFIMYYDDKGNFKDQYTVEYLLKNAILSTGWQYDGESMTFYDMFLHYCGFLHDDETSYKSISADRRSIIYNSTIIFEPAYPVYYYSSQDDGVIYRYGTVTELAKTMKNNPGYGISYGLSSAVRKNVALCISDYDQKNNLQGFEPLKSGTNQCGNTDYYSGVSLDDLINPEKAYGISIAVITGVNDPCLKHKCDEPHIPDDEFSKKNSYTLNLCDKQALNVDLGTGFLSSPSITEYTGTKISLMPESNMSASSLKNRYFKIGDSSDENQSIYCYDSVEYLFDDTMNDIGGNYNRFTFVNPKSSKVLVNRYCLLGDNYTSNEQFNIDSYKNSSIKIDFYGNTYNIYPSDSEMNSDFNITNDKKTYVVKPTNFKDDKVSFQELEKANDVTIDGTKYKYVSYLFQLNYVIPNDLLFVGNGDLTKDEGYVDGSAYNANINLSDFENSFGYSNKLISTKIVSMLGDAPGNISCPVTYNIKDTKTNINFRVISLDNPFPARDGSSRMPAENWLYDENNVYNYITTGRGLLGNWHMTDEKDSEGNPKYELDVDPELIYSRRDPMYTITLTPSTMLKIRNYNKKYSYYSMYDLGSYDSKDKVNENDKEADKLRCNEQGRECYSEFLRNSNYIPQESSSISGVCFMDGGEKKNVRTQFDSFYNPSGSSLQYTDENVAYYMNYVFKRDYEEFKHSITVGADVNYNGRMDSEDLEIMTAYAKEYVSDEVYKDKFKKYYTCANKTYKSGGPVEEDE